MEPNTTHQKPAHRLSWLVRLLGVSLVAILATAGSASAQLGDVAGTASAAAPIGQVTGNAAVGTALPALPELPMSIQQDIATPIGTGSAYAGLDRVQLCHDLYAAAPALPFPVPVEAAADSAGCMELSAYGVNAALDERIAGQSIGTDLNVPVPETPEVETGLWAEAKGLFGGAIDAVVDLF